MKKIVLLLLLIFNVAYIANVLINFVNKIPVSWNITSGSMIVISLIVSILFLFKSRRDETYHPLLSVAVLSISLASLGWFAFINYLFIVIG